MAACGEWGLTPRSQDFVFDDLLIQRMASLEAALNVCVCEVVACSRCLWVLGWRAGVVDEGSHYSVMASSGGQ